jgi:hypothetical protein
MHRQFILSLVGLTGAEEILSRQSGSTPKYFCISKLPMHDVFDDSVGLTDAVDFLDPGSCNSKMLLVSVTGHCTDASEHSAGLTDVIWFL